jgi:hypothetical protein
LPPMGYRPCHLALQIPSTKASRSIASAEAWIRSPHLHAHKPSQTIFLDPLRCTLKNLRGVGQKRQVMLTDAL